jgi:uncharacterized membrane protein YbaN (DUF454 family)
VPSYLLRFYRSAGGRVTRSVRFCSDRGESGMLAWMKSIRTNDTPEADASPRGPRRAVRILLFLAGSLSLALGALGVVLPVLPTTPFLLLAALCFARSSDRAHAWLLANRVFGSQLRDYLEGRGISWRIKAGALVFLWAAIGVSIVMFVPVLWARILLGLIALAVTVHVVTIRDRSRG